VLKEIFGPKSEKRTIKWRRLHNEDFHHLYTSPNIIRMIKSSGMRRVKHLVRMKQMINSHKTLAVKSEGKRSLEKDLGVDDRIILEWILEK
jgi:hypothetical protein